MVASWQPKAFFRVEGSGSGRDIQDQSTKFGDSQAQDLFSFCMMARQQRKEP